ncbi:hypothetical protein ACTFIV_006932, partial [Dictyostelium citrinum]
KRQKLIAI